MTTREFNTRILKVKPESVVFQPGNDIPIISDKDTEDNLLLAAKELSRTSNPIGFPTETVYGLGASALNDESVRNIYKAKNRPADNPLIVHVASVNQLYRKVLGNERIPDIYQPLIEKFWPGPLTILLPVGSNTPISPLVTANQDTFAVRLPNHAIARALLALSDEPLAAPSANASTRPSPTLASHVEHDLQGKIPYIVDGGSCDVGLESTVVDGLSEPPVLLRPGGISLEEIKKYGGEPWRNTIVAKKVAGKEEPVKTPGMKYRHYSPSATVVLFSHCGDGKNAINQYLERNHVDQNTKIALLRSRFFTEAKNINPLIIVDKCLGTRGLEISHNLFAYLREVDELGVDMILVEGIEDTNEGLAIMNRLSKAAIVQVDGSNYL